MEPHIFYEREATFFDRKRFGSEIGKLSDIIEKRLVERMSDFKGGLTLDLGTGTARFAIHVAKLGASVVAVEISKSMLRMARKKAISDGVGDKVFFIRSDALTLPFRDRSFSNCISINILNHIPAYRTALSEIHRVVKVGGFLIASFPNTLGPYVLIALLVRLRRRSIYADVYSYWFTPKEIIRSLSDEGFLPTTIRGLPILYDFALLKNPKFVSILFRIFSSPRLSYLSGKLFIRAVVRAR